MYLYMSFQAKINSKASSADPIMKTINHGKMTTLQKTPTVPSEISPINISLKIKSLHKNTSPGMSSPCQAHLPSMNDQEATVESAHQLYKKRKPSKNQSLNLELSKRGIFLHLSSEDITIEETSQSELTTKALTSNLYGK